MTNTRQDLIVAALGELNAYGVGETPSAEDVEAVGKYVEPRVAQLASDRIYYVSDIENIEDEVFVPLSILIANAAAPKFGQARQVEVDREQERALRAMNPMVRSRPARIDYF